MSWKAFDASKLPKTTGNHIWPGASNWTEGYHGTKLESVYKTMNDGYLNESTLEPGRRILDGKPGVYMFSAEKKHKCLFYARNICLMDDGVFFRFMWEVSTDRADSIGSGTDQWIARERSCRLKALFVNIRSINQVETSQELQLVWDEALEIPPQARAPVARPKATVMQPESKARPMPPPGAKQMKPDTPSPSDAPQVSTEAIGAIPMVTEEADWLQTENTDEVYQAMLMPLESDKMVEEVAIPTSTIHSLGFWHGKIP